MIVRNFGDYSHGRTEFIGLQKEKKFWFPHACKYITWIIVILSIVASSVTLIVYGMSFGMIKTYLWATAFGFSFFMGVLISAPLRILILSCLNSVFMKKTPIIMRRRIPLSLLSNPPDRKKKNQVLRHRKTHASLYVPTPTYKLQSRFEDIKYNIELRNLTVDMISYFVFTGTVCYFVLINKTQMAFYSNEMVSELVLSGHYTTTPPFKAIRSYETFIEYLDHTLLPALLLESPVNYTNQHANESEKGNSESHKKEKRESLERDKVSHNHTNFGEKAFRKGWTMNHYVKLLGKPRLRQVRVRGTCKNLKKLKARNHECSPELNLFNVEMRNFTLRWHEGPQVGLTEMQALPFSYQSAWSTGSLYYFGKLAGYPGGGYVLNLARHINDAKLVTNFLDVFQWVDVKTRAIFIEFTLYNVNLNLFNVVTLALEKSVTGYIVPSYQINTCKFIFVTQEFQYISFIMVGMFLILLFFFFLRESVRIRRTTIKAYLRWGFAMLDFSILIIGALSFLFLLLRGYYVSHLLRKLESSYNNEFVSFFHAAYWYSWSVYIEAILVLLTAFKFLRLLTFRVIFYQIQVTLNHCYKHFIFISLQLLIFLLAFGFFFYLTFINYSESFSTVRRSLSTLVGRGVANDDTFDLNLVRKGFSILTPIFFCLFILFIALLFVNVFIAIICLYFHVIRQVPLYNKYNVLDYIRFILTKKHQKDLLRLKYKKRILSSDKDPDIMRLRGGGKIDTGRKKEKKIERKDEKIEKKEKKWKKAELRRVLMKNLITENLYDPIQYMDVKGYRLLVMRHLVGSYLAYSEEERLLFRENAMKILFCDIVSFKLGLKRGEMAENEGPYFTVFKESKLEVIDRRIFNNIKRIIEKLGRQKGWFVDDLHDKEVTSAENKLLSLNNKISSLHRKLHEE